MRGLSRTATEGFTLVEMSIVLVIIGLIAGGVLVGQELIRAAYVRGQISQIESYNTAVNTFYGKYQAFPGDLNNSVALTYGFTARGANPGQGDGNGLIDGSFSGIAVGTHYSTTGEQAMFWVDLSSTVAGNLINGGFATATPTAVPSSTLTATQIGLYFPAAKLGQGNYIYIYETGLNYYALSVPTVLSGGNDNTYNVSVPVYQAYQIDKKVDDGLPASGNVLGSYLWFGFWIAPPPGINIGTIAPSASTCLDGGAGTYEYTLSVNHGNGGNCAMYFKFQ